MASGPNVNANLLEAGRLIGRAAGAGARLVVLPENFAVMGMAETDKVAIREADGRGPIQDFLSQQAARHGIWLVGGTIPLVATVADKVRAACLLFDPSGRRIARYDKIHLFDVRVVDSGEQYTESQTIEPGTEPVVVDTPIGKIGLAVCYDLRFPELARLLTLDGANILFAPSGWVQGELKVEHWQTMIKARALENGCFVIAPNQVGNIYTGHSMAVDPLGRTLVDLEESEGLAVVDIDLAMVNEVREKLPLLQNRRTDVYLRHQR